MIVILQGYDNPEHCVWEKLLIFSCKVFSVSSLLNALKLVETPCAITNINCQIVLLIFFQHLIKYKY